MPSLTTSVSAHPSWLDRRLYPFTSRWFDSADGRMHYVDEGSGEPVLFVHGTPTWSFLYRHLIRRAAARHRATRHSVHPTSNGGVARPLPDTHVVHITGDESDTGTPGVHPSHPRAGVALGRLFVRDARGAIVPIPLAQVVRLEAEDDYVAVITGTRRYLIAARIGELADELPASSFLRLHRSHVVNLDFVDRFVPFDAKRLEVRLCDGSRLLASRSASEMIRRWAR